MLMMSLSAIQVQLVNIRHNENRDKDNWLDVKFILQACFSQQLQLLLAIEDLHMPTNH